MASVTDKYAVHQLFWFHNRLQIVLST